jgi:branched-subunit amino acid transport protein
MTEVLLIIGMMLVTFGVRYPMLAIVGRLQLSPFIIRALGYVPVAVLTAITVPAVVMPEGAIDVGIDNAYLVAAVLSVIVSWRTKNLLATIVIGMGGFLLWRAVVVN